MSADYSYTYDNGGADMPVWGNLLDGVVKAGSAYATQALGNRNNRNNLTVGAPAPDNSGMMKWAMIGGGVLVAILVLVMVLKKKGG